MTEPAPAARAARPGPRRSSLPDPSRFVAISERLSGADAELDPVTLAADDGHLVGGRAMTIAGKGVAAVLALPEGLEDAGALHDVVAWLHDVVQRTDGPSPGVLAVGA
ncbi:MAG: hypothetical protein ACRDWE_05790, partial [Acidimicrobiales bacterium]